MKEIWEKMWKLYNGGIVTETEVRSELISNLTKENVHELFNGDIDVDPEILESIKEQALSGKEIKIMWMGAYIGGGQREAWDKATKSYNQGLAIVREYLEKTHAQ